IIVDCPGLGEALDAGAARLPIPVLKHNEPMFEAALAIGGRIAMLATFAPSVGSMEDEFRDMAACRSQATIETYCVLGAMDALRAGDGEEHNRLIAEAAPRFADRDAVLLAHFSTARAAPAVMAVLDRPVLTNPGTARATLKEIIGTVRQSGQP